MRVDTGTVCWRDASVRKETGPERGTGRGTEGERGVRTEVQRGQKENEGGLRESKSAANHLREGRLQRRPQILGDRTTSCHAGHGRRAKHPAIEDSSEVMGDISSGLDSPRNDVTSVIWVTA